MTTHTLSMTELRPRLPEAIDRANKFFERYIITRHGKSEAVLLAADDFEGLLETLDILSDSACVRRIAAAQKELAEGGGRSLEAIRQELRDGEGSG